VDFYTRYLERDPENPDAYYGLGESYRKDAQPRKAVEAFKAYIAKEKRPGEQKWVDRARQVVKAMEEELGQGGAVAEAEGDEVAAPVPEGDAASLLAKADRAYTEKNLKRAAQLYRAASRKDSEGVEALYKLGVVQALQGDLPGAVASWQRVLDRDPSMKLAKDNITRARAKLDAQAEKGVDDPAWGQGLEAEVKLVRRYLEENRLPMAMRVLDSLTDKHPEDAQVRLLRGEALMRMGRFEEARGHLELALGTSPGDAEVIGALGRLYLRLDQQPRALYFLRLYLERVDPQGQDPALEPTRRTVARLAADAQEP
jgi:tetratricopeptide (TPR) repeat protein